MENTYNIIIGAERISIFDRLCKLLLIVFLVSLVAFVNVRQLFVPIEYSFIIIFFIRFIIKKYTLSWYTMWSVIIVLLSFSSLFIAINQNYTFSQSISVVQPMIFCNLFIPYMKESRKNYFFILNSLIFSAFVLLFRLIISTPFYVWGTERLGGTIGYNPNTIGLILSIMGVISYYLFIVEKRKIYLISTTILGFASLFSGSRKAFAIIVLGIFLITIFTSKNYRSVILSTIISFAAVIIIYYFVMNWQPLYNVIGKRVESLLTGITGGATDTSAITRFDMIKDGLHLFVEKPLFGYGLGNFRFISPYGTYSHNNYIELLVSFGLIGTILYYSMHFTILKNSYKNLFHSERKLFALFSGIFIGIILILDFGMVSYYDEFFQLILAICYVNSTIQTSNFRIRSKWISKESLPS